MNEVVDAHLVVGGQYHDFDFARLELLKLCAERSTLRVTVGTDFADVAAISSATFLISYTCNIRPSEKQQTAIVDFVERGGRWLALHSTNTVFEVSTDGDVSTSRIEDQFIRALGNRFVDHPPIRTFRVEPVGNDHPLICGIEAFETEDEQYVNSYLDRESLIPLLQTCFDAKMPLLFSRDAKPSNQLVSYLRPMGNGAVLYNGLGHCRGHFDMRPHVDRYPRVERCSWGLPVYEELLRRGIRWGMREL